MGIYCHKYDLSFRYDFHGIYHVCYTCIFRKQWKGPKGLKRRVSVCDYTLTDPFDQNFQEVTTHLAIYYQDLDGSRRLYRHFLRNPDGAILEMFGDMVLNFGAQYDVLKDVLLQHNEGDGGLDDEEGIDRFLNGNGNGVAAGGSGSGVVDSEQAAANAGSEEMV